MKLWPSDTFADGSSEEANLEEINVKSMQTVKQILETVKASSTDDAVTKLQVNKSEE
jgi:hypothetical protein